mmetsp:Transcript_21326/g.50509  ORF Transcript_21326/g.50509 Transcript_21326/m.50509 type:complete len:204 (-) Transcript_21326:747-1358(-)
MQIVVVVRELAECSPPSGEEDRVSPFVEKEGMTWVVGEVFGCVRTLLLLGHPSTKPLQRKHTQIEVNQLQLWHLQSRDHPLDRHRPIVHLGILCMSVVPHLDGVELYAMFVPELTGDQPQWTRSIPPADVVPSSLEWHQPVDGLSVIRCEYGIEMELQLNLLVVDSLLVLVSYETNRRFPLDKILLKGLPPVASVLAEIGHLD